MKLKPYNHELLSEGYSFLVEDENLRATLVIASARRDVIERHLTAFESLLTVIDDNSHVDMEELVKRAEAADYALGVFTAGTANIVATILESLRRMDGKTVATIEEQYPALEPYTYSYVVCKETLETSIVVKHKAVRTH